MNAHEFQTPDWCCTYMAGLLPRSAWTVLEPTPGDGNLVRAMQKRGFNVSTPYDFWAIKDRFDAIAMNPPFSPMATGYVILDRCLELSDTVVALMPWLVLINSELRTKKLFSFGIKSITHLPRSTFPGTRVQCCVLEMSKGFTGETIFKQGVK